MRVYEIHQETTYGPAQKVVVAYARGAGGALLRWSRTVSRRRWRHCLCRRRGCHWQPLACCRSACSGWRGRRGDGSPILRGHLMQNNSTNHYDLVILGSGSTAFAAALRAAELGKTAVMTEHRVIGGTCVNRGCLPSKNLIEAARLVYDAANPRYPGLTGQRLPLDFPALIAQKDQVVHDYRGKKYESIIGPDKHIEIITGDVRFTSDRTVAVGNRELTGERFLIATGSRPVIPAIPGLDQTPYLTSDLLTSDESMELTELPASLVILGGGYIALELGQMFARFGTAVTIIERGGQLLAHGYEPEVGLTMADILREEGLTILTGVQVQSMAANEGGVSVRVQLHGRERVIQAERVLVATGRQPNTESIGLDQAGVAVDEHGAVRVDAYLQTNVPHIFAAGDVIGRETGSQQATPVGAHDGGIATRNAFGCDDAACGRERKRVDHRVIPRAIFTDPQIGIVGMTEAEAIAAGHSCWCNTVPMEYVPRAGAIRDTRGIIKMVADADSNEVLGVSMVGVNAGEVIHEAAMALRFHATIDDFIDLIHVYPTMAEALKIVAISRYKDPAKLS
ncbi:MAG: mercury(II) reductase, partial [Dehalococcoidia bacterium]